MKDHEAFRKTLDSIFKRDDIRGIWGEILDGTIAYYVGQAFYTLLNKDTAHIAIGRDMREGSPDMAGQLTKLFQS